jgi:hypothetical protein
MKKHMRALLADKQMARELAAHGLRTIQRGIPAHIAWTNCSASTKK